MALPAIRTTYLYTYIRTKIYIRHVERLIFNKLIHCVRLSCDGSTASPRGSSPESAK